jgi:bifunctional N-acetylglucosamine-1-phosphate-uridyltransferase/glucosamine-1-phosphate-acetyltransferase GlmU-like protein
MALDEGARFRSRVSLYMHPLGGRPILWHVLGALAGVSPRPERIVVVHHPGAAIALPEAQPVALALRTDDPDRPGEALRAVMSEAYAAEERVMMVYGAVPLVSAASLQRALAASGDRAAALRGSAPDEGPIAVAGDARSLPPLDSWRALSAAEVRASGRAEGIHVHDRASLADAGVALRDRIVRQHQDNGVTFLLPASVWLDCDVVIGEDSVIYPGVVLEGRTEIGAECVIGPYSHIIEATIGRGVELKGWNYIARTSIRNQAVLEPHVRRGFE